LFNRFRAATLALVLHTVTAADFQTSRGNCCVTVFSSDVIVTLSRNSHPS